MKRIGFFISFIFLGLVFGGCHNLLSESNGGNSGSNDSGLVLVTGRISFDSNLGQAINNPLNNISQIPDDRAISNTSGKTMKAFVRATADGKAPVDATVSGNTYSLELSQGSWTITCHIFYVESTDTSTNFDSNTYTFEGEKTINVTSSGASDADVQMGFTAGIQGVYFAFKINKDTNITKYSLYVDSGPRITKHNLDFGDLTSSTFTTGQTIDTGRHTFLLAFYDDNDNRIYTIQDSLYVLKGISDILYNDNSENYVNNSGAIEITTDVIQNRFVNKIFYVDNTVTNDTDRIGTYFDPLSSIQKAVNLIDSVNDGTSEYEIRLNTDFKDESTSSYQSNMDNAYICLKGLKKSIKLKICSKDDTKKTIDVNRNSTYTGRIISAWSEDTTKTIDLTLENLILKGGCMNNGDGGALVISAGKLTVDNCEFIGNSSTNSGGAINIGDKLSSGSEIKNTKFDGNTCIGTTSSQYGNGGAIYTKRSLTFTNCVFTENGAKGTITDSGRGGAIYCIGNSSNSPELIINGSEFIHNYSSKDGGALYLGIKSLTRINQVDTTPTVFKFNYGKGSNAIFSGGSFLTNASLYLNDNIYFNNSDNIHLDSDYSSYKTKSTISNDDDLIVDIKVNNYSSDDNMTYTNFSNLYINYVKTDDSDLPVTPSETGSNAYYANKYVYASLVLHSTVSNYSAFRMASINSNHIYKFIKCPIALSYPYTSGFNYCEPVSYEVKFIAEPKVSSLLQMPSNQICKVTNETDLSQLLNLYSSATESYGNTFNQTADINCSSLSWTNCKFTDIYDGQNYKIKDLSITNSENHTALFGTTIGATLKNIILDHPVINSNVKTPGLTGGAALIHSMQNSKVINCSVLNGQVNGYQYMGGLIGYVTNTSYPCFIINSSYEGILKLNGSQSGCKLGGILAYNNGGVPITIINCFYKGEIQNNNTTCTSLNPAGIADELSSGKTIYNCFVSVKFTGSGNKKYLIGDHGSAKNCYVDNLNYESSELPTTLPDNDATNQNYYSQLKDDLLDGDLLIEGFTEGKIQVYKYSGSGTDFTLNTSQYPIYTISAALNKFVEVNNAATNFKTNFAELKPWSYDAENGIHFSADGNAKDPVDIYFPGLHPHTSSLGDNEPALSDNKTIWIRNGKDLQEIDEWKNGNTIKLMADLDLPNYTILGESNPVSFKFDGNNHTITYNNASDSSDKKGLIGGAKDIEIKDLTVHSSIKFTANSGQIVSCLVAQVQKGKIENCKCIIDGLDFSAIGNIYELTFGGIVGEVTSIINETYSGDVIINNCEISSTVPLDFSTTQNNGSLFVYGGVIGWCSINSTSVTVNKCINKLQKMTVSTTGGTSNDLSNTKVSTSSSFGGIIGCITNANVNIYNCINKQQIDIDFRKNGGIVGYYGDLVTPEWDADDNTIKIINCINEKLPGDKHWTYVSGIINSAFQQSSNIIIKNCAVQDSVLTTVNHPTNGTKNYYYYGMTNCVNNSNPNFQNNYWVYLSTPKEYCNLYHDLDALNKDATIDYSDKTLNTLDKCNGVFLYNLLNTYIEATLALDYPGVSFIKWKPTSTTDKLLTWDE
jgi:predicted outer membrane repeat protein